MSIYIKDFKMPKNCDDCYFCSYGFCYNLDRDVENPNKRDNDCPLVEVRDE